MGVTRSASRQVKIENLCGLRFIRKLAESGCVEGIEEILHDGLSSESAFALVQTSSIALLGRADDVLSK
jgi:hypothetical protein